MGTSFLIRVYLQDIFCRINVYSMFELDLLQHFGKLRILSFPQQVTKSLVLIYCSGIHPLQFKNVILKYEEREKTFKLNKY